jgi:hypothetical protein
MGKVTRPGIVTTEPLVPDAFSASATRLIPPGSAPSQRVSSRLRGQRSSPLNPSSSS